MDHPPVAWKKGKKVKTFLKFETLILGIDESDECVNSVLCTGRAERFEMPIIIGTWNKLW
jgi:hypothetical protein